MIATTIMAVVMLAWCGVTFGDRWPQAMLSQSMPEFGGHNLTMLMTSQKAASRKAKIRLGFIEQHRLGTAT